MHIVCASFDPFDQGDASWQVLTSAAEEAEAKLASIEQTIQEKNLELGQARLR